MCLTMLHGLRYLILVFCLAIRSASAESNVGCFFSPALCGDEEDCFDDNAFGRCQSAFVENEDSYRHLLGSGTVRLLERELARLFAGGYRWRHQYTQCVVQNILYTSRHSISYDPGLCSRLMQFTLPDVPPEILEDLESPSPEELAYIKFKPNRDNPANAVFADEIFTPPISPDIEENDINAPKKRESTFRKRQLAWDSWSTSAPRSEFDRENAELPSKEMLLNEILRGTKDTVELFENYKPKTGRPREERYPEDDLSAIRMDLSSDMNQRPAFSEGGTEWLPVDDDSNFILGNDIVDPYEKKRVRLPNDIDFSNEIEREQEEESNDVLAPDNNREDPLDDSFVYRDSGSDVGDDSNFRFNPKHINFENDLTKFNQGKQTSRKNRISDDSKLRDVIEDDYFQDHMTAIIPAKGYPAEMSDSDKQSVGTFVRDSRYDIKKPGPLYMEREDEDGDTTHDDDEMALNGDAADFVHELHESNQQNQLEKLLGTPVHTIKGTTTIVLPVEQEVFEGAQHVLLTGAEEIPIRMDSNVEMKEKPNNNKPFERMQATDHREVLEGIDLSKDLKDEEITAQAAQRGEGSNGPYDAVDATRAFLTVSEKDVTEQKAQNLVDSLEKMLKFSRGTFADLKIKDQNIIFKVNPNTQNLNATDVARKAVEELSPQLKAATGLTVEKGGIGDQVQYQMMPDKDRRLQILAFALCGGVSGVLLIVAGVYVVRRHERIKDKLQSATRPDSEPSQDYQDLCRQRMASKPPDKPESIHAGVHSPKRIRSLSQEGQVSSSSHSSTSSWNEEPVTSNMDITTGHIILAYMEDHLKNKDRLDREWEGLCAYEAELCSTTAASLPQNIKKNRYTDVLPYDHSRVLLTEGSNVSTSDYINASSITDHDPRNPAYIATQGPLPQTAADFWQMIWEQGSVVIVMLSRLMENGVAMCHRYWPEEGSEVYHIYEVHLVSEHIWCDDYLVRSFYLKNLRTNETRTVTQFHFMSWPDNGVPNSTKALLEFRRKVNKSYRGRSCPIVVHCSDGIGRTGTYVLIDMVLNRMAKGAKEIDIAATLEHVRDQRAGMVKTKAQFEFVLMAIAEEVHAILKALSQ